MRDALNDRDPGPLMAAWNAESQIHLIVGANPLAAARCAKSLDAGARPIVIAPETVDMHFTLSEHVTDGSAQWVRREFQDSDLTSLGREEVDRVVDMVFVTLGGDHALGRSCRFDMGSAVTDLLLQVCIFRNYAGA